MNIPQVADVMERTFRAHEETEPLIPLPGLTRFEVAPENDPCPGIRAKIPVLSDGLLLRSDWRGGQHFTFFGGRPDDDAINLLVDLLATKKTTFVILEVSQWKVMNATTIASLFSQAQARDRCVILIFPRTETDLVYWDLFVKRIQ